MLCIDALRHPIFVKALGSVNYLKNLIKYLTKLNDRSHVKYQRGGCTNVGGLISAIFYAVFNNKSILFVKTELFKTLTA